MLPSNSFIQFNPHHSAISVDPWTSADVGWVPVGADIQLVCSVDDAGAPPARLTLRREANGAVIQSTPAKEVVHERVEDAGADGTVEEDVVQLVVNVSVSKRKQYNKFICGAEQVATGNRKRVLL